jgi:hypothetical protein
VIDDGAVQAGPEGGARDTLSDTLCDTLNADVRTPEETIASGSEPPAEDVVASPEASLDSGIGTDTLPSGASVEEPGEGLGEGLGEGFGEGFGRRDTIASESSFQEPSASRTREETVPPPPAPERRSSAGALIGSGLLGGLIGAGLLYGLQAWQGSPAQDDPRLAQLEQRVNALRQQPAPSGQPQANTQALEGRLQALESARGELDQRLQAVQGTAQQAATQAQDALNRPAPEAPQPSPQNEAALTDLSNRFSTLEEQVRANAQNATNAASVTQELDRRIVDLDRCFADQDRRYGEAERRLGEAERRFADTDRRFTEQEQRLATLSQQAAENTRNAEAASQTGTKVVLAGRLNDALKSGTPYTQVLDGVKKAGADASRVAPLEPFAQQGAPTVATLAHSFEPVETAILRESRGPAEGWTDRLLRMADRVVTVKPVNEPGSTGVPALVARIRQALERGDVVEAAAAWNALPEPSRRLSEDWGRQVRAVAEAHQAAQAISADALATLNRTTQ